MIESCHSTWLFDEKNRRFRRLLKGTRLGTAATTDWRPYDHLVIGDSSDAFLVFLDPSGRRALRSWHHTGRCERCGTSNTAELSLEDLKSTIAS